MPCCIKYTSDSDYAIMQVWKDWRNLISGEDLESRGALGEEGDK